MAEQAFGAAAPALHARAPAGVAAWPGARLAWALGGGLALLLALRALSMLASGAGLHVDEAQYWDWSRRLQWGYWSKPPGVAALIAASTGLLGDGLLGVRLLGMACWPASAGVLALLAWRIGGREHGAAAALWTAALFAATPAAGLLGLVVTTDGPLMLCWSLAMLASWHAVQAMQAPARGLPGGLAWAATGLALGLGLLAKYTAAAFALGVLPLLWGALAAPGARSAVWRALAGPALAAVVALLMLLPNLLWNARHGWPTLSHTAAITAQAAARPGAGPLASLAEFLAGQVLLLGPAALAVAVLVWRRRAGAAAPARPGEGFALATALPLLGLGALQALNAKAQMNWTAPALAGLCLWLGLRAARAGLGRPALLASTAAGLALSSAVALAASLSPALAGRSADIWARMRGWDETLSALRPALDARPGLAVVATERDVLVQARRVWRSAARPVLAWPAEGRPHNHYQQFEALVPAGAGAAAWPQAVLLLCEDRPAPDQHARYARWQPLAQALAPSGRRLALWQGDGLRAAPAAPGVPLAGPLVAPLADRHAGGLRP